MVPARSKLKGSRKRRSPGSIRRTSPKVSNKDDEDTGPTELLERPKEYLFKFKFPETSQL